MDTFDPAAAFVTTRSTGPFVRIARWLGRGFEEIGRDLDVVFLEGPAGSRREGHVREIGLAAPRAARSIRPLRQYLRAHAPPLALVTPGYLAPFALVAGRGTATAVVPWEAGFAAREAPELARRMRLLPLLQKATYRRARRLAAVSPDVARFIGGLAGRDDVVVIPNPVDAREIRALAGSGDSPAPGFVVCGVGTLTDYKGYDVLLDALARAAPRLGEWTLRLVGDGPRRAELERTAQRLGIAGRVSFLGFVENPYPLLRDSSVFVQPSRFEGFGVTIVEALALRVPVIASSSGGPAEVLDGGRYGLLVPPDDPDALADALVSVANDPDVRARLTARADAAVARYAPAEVASAVMRLVQETVPR
jgi:glycosyltransferase involved in cell wall biosynthesis